MKFDPALRKPKTKLGTFLAICFVVYVAILIAQKTIDFAFTHRVITADTQFYLQMILLVPGIFAGLGVFCGGAVWLFRWVRPRRKSAPGTLPQ